MLLTDFFVRYTPNTFIQLSVYMISFHENQIFLLYLSNLVGLFVCMVGVEVCKVRGKSIYLPLFFFTSLFSCLSNKYDKKRND